MPTRQYNRKILFYDLETSPIIVPAWSLWNQDIYYENVIMPWHIICAAWKWEDEPVESIKAPHGCDPMKDREVVKAVHTRISQADVIVAHNGDKFDLKKFNTRAVLHGLDPVPPVKTIDTLKVARKHFKFDSNRLDYLGEVLGLGKKMPTPKGLWQRAIAADLIANPEMKKKERHDVFADQSLAIDTMNEYCERDVELLEDVYFTLRPYMKNHPNSNLFSARIEDGCPTCGSDKLIRRGFLYTQVGAKQRYRCANCGSWSSSGKSILKASIR